MRLIQGDLLSACCSALSKSYPNAYMQCREAVCTIFKMVFGMTRPGSKPTPYRVRGGHALIPLSQPDTVKKSNDNDWKVIHWY